MMLLALPLAGCGRADASPFDSADPVNCLAIFGATSAAARQQSEISLSNELNARIIYMAKTHGGPDWLKDVTPQSRQIAAALEAAGDDAASLRLFDECRAKQDADPAFKAGLPALLAETASW